MQALSIAHLLRPAVIHINIHTCCNSVVVIYIWLEFEFNPWAADKIPDKAEPKSEFPYIHVKTSKERLFAVRRKMYRSLLILLFL